MHPGVFEGQKAKDQPVRILILGESHHINKKDKENSEAGKEATYPTCRVVAEYFEDTEKKNKNLRFFEKIAKSFGIIVPLDEEADAFWNKVYFGNYISVLCGVGDNTAENMIKDEDNRKTYNNDLFKFVNEKGIDVIFCFGRRVFNALPSLYDKSEDKGKVLNGITIGGKADYISKCVYLPHVSHGNTDILLEKELSVFCMRHPSGKGGYSYENYRNYLEQYFRECVY